MEFHLVESVAGGRVLPQPRRVEFGKPRMAVDFLGGHPAQFSENWLDEFTIGWLQVSVEQWTEGRIAISEVH
jgi:hypothetical protein